MIFLSFRSIADPDPNPEPTDPSDFKHQHY
jgi:hypothetical protein